MTAPLYPNIKRGRMTDEDKAEIERLVGTLKNPHPAAIARRINRHPATVKWHMLTRGLYSGPVGYGKRSYKTRGGQERHPWTPEQDTRREELRTAGKSYREVAEILTSEFGVPRNLHSVQVRSVMSAARDES